MNAPEPWEQSDDQPIDDDANLDESLSSDDEMLDSEDEAPDLPETPLVAPTRFRLWSHVMLILVVFISGAVVGGSLTFIFSKDKPEKNPTVGAPAELAKQIVLRWREKLELTDEQADKIFQIVRMRQESLTELRREIEPQFEAELATMREQIDEVLNDEQQKKWHDIVKSIRERFRPPRGGDSHHGYHGGPGGGHPGWSRGGQEAFFKSQDKDGDGRISRDEASSRLQNGFDRIDENKDGYLEPAELRRAFEAMKKQMQERFKRQQGQRGRNDASERPSGRPSTSDDSTNASEDSTSTSDNPTSDSDDSNSDSFDDSSESDGQPDSEAPTPTET